MRNEAPEGEERILHTLFQSESLMLGALLLLLPVCVCVCLWDWLWEAYG